MNREIFRIACAAALLSAGAALAAGEYTDKYAQASAGRGQSKESRQLVELPGPLLQRKLEEMRNRLAILWKLQAALSIDAYAEAADLAEHHLGMSSLPTQGTEEAAQYMPYEMREMDSALHQAASRFALEATRAGATVDARLAMAALSEVIERCVACHTAYRFR
jgi:hypothetical protein